MWSHLGNSSMLLRRENVRLAVRELDPENVHTRQRRRRIKRKCRNPGPNYVWHIDSHDKLKPYDISIYGCIDAYFRHIIWLEGAATNKMPELIAQYNLDAVKQMKEKPKIIKAKKNFLYFRKRNILIFQERETLKNFLYFRK